MLYLCWHPALIMLFTILIVAIHVNAFSPIFTSYPIHMAAHISIKPIRTVFGVTHTVHCMVMSRKPSLVLSGRNFQSDALSNPLITSTNNDQQHQVQDLSVKGWKWPSMFMLGTVTAVSIGVFIAAYRNMESKRKLDNENINCCPYCRGTGTLLCGSCLGTDTKSLDGSGPCSKCSGSAVVLCVNCKGSGSMLAS